ncbi:hypothetical protein CDAR_207261 [Caerostris darwini]|uniref:Uncharacterized protein n=1 Tax=Caerostris darwini TaxID=1538125 RepID=A0AAV4MEU2_9ARAC|nr:hypothetical protein CDAR_207261 [Caerostris darwini]
MRKVVRKYIHIYEKTVTDFSLVLLFDAIWLSKGKNAPDMKNLVGILAKKRAEESEKERHRMHDEQQSLFIFHNEEEEIKIECSNSPATRHVRIRVAGKCF